MYILDKRLLTKLTLGDFICMNGFQMHHQLGFIFEHFFAILARIFVKMFGGYVQVVVFLNLKQ